MQHKLIHYLKVVHIVQHEQHEQDEAQLERGEEQKTSPSCIRVRLARLPHHALALLAQADRFQQIVASRAAAARSTGTTNIPIRRTASPTTTTTTGSVIVMIVHYIATAAAAGRFVIVVVRTDNMISTIATTANARSVHMVVLAPARCMATGGSATATERIVVVVPIVQAVMVVVAVARVRVQQLVAVDKVERLEQRREGVEDDEHDRVQHKL